MVVLLLIGGAILAGVAAIGFGLELALGLHPGVGLPLALGIALVFSGLGYVAWKGNYLVAAWGLVTFFIPMALYPAYLWGIMLPEAELLAALGIIVVSIVIGGRMSAGLSLMICSVVLALGYLQSAGVVQAQTGWLATAIESDDALFITGGLLLITVICWLANGEVEKLLSRAEDSEAALKTERDRLKTAVAEQSNELEAAQLEQTLAMERFAEFGRLSAGWMHDVANPLTAVSLNLEQLGEQQRSELLQEAQRGIGHIEEYIKAARMQLQNESEPCEFQVLAEIKRIATMLQYKARQARVELIIQKRGEVTFYGDVVRFNQVVANLIANAIEAYETAVRPLHRVVTVTIERDNERLLLRVHDWAAIIPRSNQARLFAPFYSTKKSRGHSIGIGLALVKRIVEDEFCGTIEVTSSRKHGTAFILALSRDRR